MQQLLDVAALALFVFLVVAFAYVLRRAAGVVAVTRGDETFRRAGAALAERAVAAITPGAERIEGVRRRSAAPAVSEVPGPQVQEARAARLSSTSVRASRRRSTGPHARSSRSSTVAFSSATPPAGNDSLKERLRSSGAT
jgi:hypothetical protein